MSNTGFAYINYKQYPMAAWEITIGRFQSTIRAEDRYGVSVWTYNRFMGYSSSNSDKKFILNDFELELYRRKYFPDKMSRLTSLFLFQTLDEAVRGSIAMGFEDTDKYIAEIGLIKNQGCTRVDANWITYCLGQTDNDDWMQGYWSGKEYPGGSPHWELLVSGFGIVLDKKIRERAYACVCDEFPNSRALLEFASIAFNYGLSLKHDNLPNLKRDDLLNAMAIIPFLSIDNGVLHGDYIVKGSEELCKENIFEQILGHGLNLNPHTTLSPLITPDTICLLDLSDLFFSINLDSDKDHSLISEILGINENNLA